MTLQDYLTLPWTVHGRGMRDTPDGALYYVISIEELPGFSAVGDTRAEAEGELADALEAYLSAALANGERPRLPPQVRAA